MFFFQTSCAIHKPQPIASVDTLDRAKTDLKKIENSLLIIAGKLDIMTPLKSSIFLNRLLKKVYCKKDYLFVHNY